MSRFCKACYISSLNSPASGAFLRQACMVCLTCTEHTEQELYSLCTRPNSVCIGLFCRNGYHEELVGFITARVCLLHECNPTDRVLMNLNSAYLDGQRVLYILTLGVLEGARQQGIGSALLRLILEEVSSHHGIPWGKLQMHLRARQSDVLQIQPYHCVGAIPLLDG